MNRNDKEVYLKYQFIKKFQVRNYAKLYWKFILEEE